MFSNEFTMRKHKNSDSSFSEYIDKDNESEVATIENNSNSLADDEEEDQHSRTSTSIVSKIKDVWYKTTQGFVSLKGSPPELYKAYILKFLDSYSYFSFSVIFTLFLSEDFGFTDIEAGTYYGAWGALITIYGLFAGMVVDNLGVAKSLKVGFVLSLVARICILITTNSTILLFHILVTLPMGNCLGIPVLTTGIRRYTTESNRGFAFGLFYVIMNVAALLSGPIVDVFTILYKVDDDENATNENGNNENDDGSDDDIAKSWAMTSYRAIIATGVIANIIACLVTFTVREIKVANNQGPNASGISGFNPIGGTFLEILSETIKAPSFKRFLVVCLLTLNVRMIFRHLDATLPKYLVREFGKDIPKGTIYSINPALIIILVPLITAATTKIEPLIMIHYGTYVSAASVFFLVASTSIWSSIAFVVVLSIGEAIWSPRLYDYTMSVCKEGREGTYMALSSAPLFLAKLPVGFLSGLLLSKYCPEDPDAERHSQTMWLIIGLITASSPICLTCLWGYISKKDDSDGGETAEERKGKYTELSTTPVNPSG